MKRAIAHRRASHGPHIAITRETTTNKKGFKGQIVKTNDMAKKMKEWQAYLGQTTTRPVPGNVGELRQDPAPKQDRSYDHTPLTQPSHLWADTITAGDKGIQKGRRYITKGAPIQTTTN